MPITSIVAGFYSSTGQEIGLAVNGFLYIPWGQGGIVLQDSAGALHLLQMGTDGRLTSVVITV